MDKIIIGNVSHDRKELFFFYGSLIAMSLKDGKEYAMAGLTEFYGTFKDIQELEKYICDNCLNQVTNQKEKEVVKAVFADLAVLYRYFEADPELTQYIMYHRCRLPEVHFNEVRKALRAQDKSTALSLLDAIERAYEKISTQEFTRLRNEVYYSVTRFDELFNNPKP